MKTYHGLTFLLCCVLLSISPTFSRVLTREELLPLLTKFVVIPNQHKVPPPTAHPWPEEFTIKFTTDDGKASGVLMYDWGNKQQAIVHGPGSSHCLSRGSHGLCYILENEQGTFEVSPSERKCELTFSDVGSVPPTWVSHGVFVGVEDVKGVKCNRFNYPPTMHAWLETVEEGLPCAFVFPNPSLTYYFDAGSMKIGQPAMHLFRVPEYCPQSKEEPLVADL